MVILLIKTNIKHREKITQKLNNLSIAETVENICIIISTVRFIVLVL
jgi:hypothetical protein